MMQLNVDKTKKFQLIMKEIWVFLLHFWTNIILNNLKLLVKDLDKFILMDLKQLC
jgi:hypothetical protein